jgi:hypothetical protein
MRLVTLLLAAVCLGGCVDAQTRVPSNDRHAAYLDELQRVRDREWGPCVTTMEFLQDTGQAGVPTVLKALDRYGAPADAMVRMHIVSGAQYYAPASGTNDVVRPIMQRAQDDPDARVNTVARDWLRQRQEKREASKIPAAQPRTSAP